MANSLPDSTGGPGRIISLDERRPGAQASKAVKSFSGGSGGGGPIVDAETRRHLDNKMDTVRAQNDARFSEVMSKLDGLTVRMDALPRPVGFWQLAGMAATALVVFFTLLAVFADRFDGGIAASGLLDEFAESQQARDEKQDASMVDFGAKLDQVLEAVRDQPQPSPEAPKAP